MYMSEDLNSAVNDIITQLKGNKTAAPAAEDEILDPDKLEEFLIKKSSKLINKSLTIVDNVNDYISSAPENRDVTAMAELIKASSSAIETLNKLHTAKERNETQKEVKKMDVEAKERMNITDNQTKVLMSREDIMNALIDKVDEKTIDI